jgi:hypothetical protein
MTGIANATTEPDEHAEIEITEEMAEAGARILYGFNRNFHSEHDFASRIYRKMAIIYRSHKPQVLDQPK